MSDVKRGDHYTFDRVRVFVTRVARDGTWADIFCRDPYNDTSWSKRQPLPFPTTFVKAGE